MCLINYGYRLTRLLRINYLLISQPFITVEQMDDAAVVKASLCQRSLHGLVIPVGINADVTGLCEAIIKDAGHDPMVSMRTCHTMKNIIRSVGVNPLSIVNDSVGGIVAGNEGKSGYGSAVLHQQVAETISNVILYLRYRRMAVSPLMRIAILSHDPPPTLYEVEDHRQVLNCCFSDESFHLQCLQLVHQLVEHTHVAHLRVFYLLNADTADSNHVKESYNVMYTKSQLSS